VPRDSEAVSTVVDERKLLAAGFRLEGRNLVHGQSLWSREEDEGIRSYSDDEAQQWLAEHGKGKKGRRDG
jgi:hypothetical protein